MPPPGAQTGLTDRHPAPPAPHRRPALSVWFSRPSHSKLFDFAAFAVFCVIAFAIYGAYATKGAWFYDDWSVYSLLRDQHGSFFTGVSACAASIPGSRSLACLFHAGEFTVFRSHRTDYQFASIIWLIIGTTLAYVIARRCGLQRVWSFLLGALLLLFPADDATRLWDVASIGQYVMGLTLGATLLALLALESRGRRSWVLGVSSALLAVFAMVTYEIAIPLVALSGLLFVLVYRSRRALVCWGIGIGLVAAFVGYRLVIVPVSAASGLNVPRNVTQTIDRASTLLRTAWSTWKYVYVPGRAGTYALIGLSVVVLASVVTARDEAMRRRMIRWIALGLFGVALAGVSALVFLTANDLYLPLVDGTFNRLNLPGSFGYVVMAIALLGVVFEVVVRFTRLRSAAVVAVAALIVVSAAHQISISTAHIQAWEASWKAQQHAIPGYRVALRDVPHDASIVGFDTPEWEAGYVPVFAASWDLRGAIDYETDVDPPVASPLFPGMSCGATGVVIGTTVIVPYSTPKLPMYFVSPSRRLARQIESEDACNATIAQWGRPPYFASS